MKPVALAAYERQTGHPCPQRVLDPDNATAFELVSLTCHEVTRPFVETAFRLATAAGEPEMQLLWRVTSTLRDPLVVKHLNPEPPKASESIPPAR